VGEVGLSMASGTKLSIGGEVGAPA
jgi:hypothetical protein